jgi:uncharacterized membrane protein
LVVLGGFLRFYRIGHQSIWGDEALTLQVYTAGDSIVQAGAHIWGKAFHPPLYFLTVFYWYKLGDSELMLRLPSAVFGLAAIPLLYLFVNRLFGRSAAGIAALTAAVSPFHIWYSQEARMYTLQVLLALGSMLFFLKAWHSRRLSDFGLYGLFTLLALFTHVGTVFLAAAQAAFVSGACLKNWRRQIHWIGIQAAVLIAFAPWALRFLSSRSAGGLAGVGFEREASPLHLLYGLYTFAVGYSLGPSVAALHYLSVREAILRHVPGILLPALIFGTLILLGALRSYRENREGFRALMCYFAVPLFLAALATFAAGAPLNPRYVTTAIIPFWILTALGVTECAALPRRVIILGATVVVGLSLYNHYYQPAYAKQDMRSAAYFVQERARTADVILISSVELGGPFIYYFDRRDVPYFGYPQRAGCVDPERLADDVNAIVQGRRRAWLILGRTWSSDPRGLIPAYFSRRYSAAERRTYPGVDVRCFDLTVRRGNR